MRKLHQVFDLVLIDSFERHRVDLDLQPGLFRGVDAAHDDAEIAPSGDLAKLHWVERVERDVDPPHAGAAQRLGVTLELAAVGRQGQFVERARFKMTAEPLEQPDDILAHQRLAAGDTEFADAARDEGAA